ncbi:MAG TPA: hypothetical protein DDX54_06345 [Rhodospirillaceae bacterium]|nr:hypothetical protein [Rhodospirillaceae bacterium]
MVARARLYGLFALILAAVGALLFAYVYFGVYEGDIQASGAGFSLILICLVHFAPAAVLAFLGRLEDRRAKALLAALQK